MANIQINKEDYETVSGYAAALEREGFDLYPMTEEGNYAVKLGLISEIGELCDIDNKRIRGDAAYQDPYKLEQMWLKELGDCLWFVVRLGWRFGMRKFCVLPIRGEGYPEDLIYDVHCVLRECASNMTKVHVFNDALKTVFIIARQKGFTPQQVMGTNLEKLMDRKARSVIKGDGDER